MSISVTFTAGDGEEAKSLIDRVGRTADHRAVLIAEVAKKTPMQRRVDSGQTVTAWITLDGDLGGPVNLESLLYAACHEFGMDQSQMRVELKGLEGGVVGVRFLIGMSL